MGARFAMILYVNRSGSTLLSRLLTDWFEDTFVFPEISFLMHLMVDRSRGKIHQGQSLFDVVSADPRIDALGLDPAALYAICCRSSSRDLAAFLTELAMASGGRDAYRVIVFKFETLLYLHDEVLEAFSGLKTIHLVRDPRAVVGSMLRSDLPEKPGFNMARNSLIFAARHWRSYVRRASAVGRAQSLLTIRFESIGREPEAVVTSLSNFLELPASRHRTSQRRYRISKLDRDLHAHVFRPFLEERASSWASELPERAVAVVEALCAPEMRQFGYAPSGAAPSRFAMLRAYAAHGVQMLDHTFRTLAVYMRRTDRFSSLSRRAKVYLMKR
ncbi:Sulfotransferase [Methylorubrum aminovorans]